MTQSERFQLDPTCTARVTHVTGVCRWHPVGADGAAAEMSQRESSCVRGLVQHGARPMRDRNGRRSSRSPCPGIRNRPRIASDSAVRSGDPCCITCESLTRILRAYLYLGEASIHKQFRSHDIAAVVGREKHHGLRDLIGCANLPSGVHANAAILQVRVVRQIDYPPPIGGNPNRGLQCSLAH
jgi:hypothetical protein